MGRILIVDDNRAVRVQLREVLEFESFQVSEAADGRTALQMFQNEPPDTVLLDYKMDGMDGMEVLREMKRLIPYVPVVMLTGHGDIPTAVMAKDCGAFDFIEKGGDIEKLVKTLKVAVDTKMGLPSLSPKQREALEWVARGKSSPDISAILGISESMVNAHIDKAMHKLNAKTRTHAVAIAAGLKLITVENKS